MRISTLLFILIPSFSFAAKDPSTQPVPSTPSPIQSTQTQETDKEISQRIKDVLGITYFTYFFGSGLHPDNFDCSPNQLGKPDNDGIYTQNQISIRYKFSKNIALDFQSRFKIIFNNYQSRNPNFNFFRWETPRIGIKNKIIVGIAIASNGAGIFG